MQHRADALDPPTKAFGAHALPIVERIAPELARLAEIIGRHTGDDARATIFIQLDVMFVDPDISRIMRDEDGDVADDLDLSLVGITLERGPLFEEEKLPELARLDLFAQMRARRQQRARVARNHRPLPLVPSRALAHVLHRAKERVV